MNQLHMYGVLVFEAEAASAFPRGAGFRFGLGLVLILKAEAV